MLKIIILKGLPASGKSTWAKDYIKQHSKEKWKIINKDSLRAMLDDSKWSRDNEKFILKVRDNIIQSALGMGYNVIVDDTNLADKHEASVRLVAKDKAEVEIKNFDVSVEECVKRDLKRGSSVGSDVIYKMYNQFLYKRNFIADVSKKGGEAIIVDIDGTLAKMQGRGLFDWRKVGSDSCNEPVAKTVRAFKAQGTKVIIVTGRDGCCEEETREWLYKYDIVYDEFFIRPEGNSEPDTIIKKRIYFDEISDEYSIVAVFDDRPCVIRMWKDLGFFVFDCNQDYYKVDF